MDYTTLQRVKDYMDSQEVVKDTILEYMVTTASRYVDRLCTSQSNVADYFKAESITNEIVTNGVIDFAGRLWVYPHKPIINSVTAMSYRYHLGDADQAVDLTKILLQPETVMFEGFLTYQEMIYVKISYNGGMATSPEDLPDDLQDLAAIMAVRLYKEARSGLGDVIGVQQLGMLVYTKAFAQRIIDTVNVGGFARIAPWT